MAGRNKIIKCENIKMNEWQYQRRELLDSLTENLQYKIGLVVLPNNMFRSMTSKNIKNKIKTKTMV